MAVYKYNALGSVQTLLTTDLNALASGAKSAASTAFDNANASNRHLFGTFELYVTYGTAPTAGRTVDLYLLPTVDGTNYADGSASVDPASNLYAGSFVLRNVNTAQRLVLAFVELPPTLFKAMVINRGGQAFSASGHTLKMAVYSYESP